MAGLLATAAQVQPARTALTAGDVASPAVKAAYHFGPPPGSARAHPAGRAGWGSAWLGGPAVNCPAPVAPPGDVAAHVRPAAAACDQAGPGARHADASRRVDALPPLGLRSLGATRVLEDFC